MNLSPAPMLPPRPDAVPAPDRVELGRSLNRAEVIDFSMTFGAVTVRMCNEEEGDLYPISQGPGLGQSQWRLPTSMFAPGDAEALEAWFCAVYWALRADAIEAAHRRAEQVAQHFGYEPRPVAGTSV